MALIGERSDPSTPKAEPVRAIIARAEARSCFSAETLPAPPMVHPPAMPVAAAATGEANAPEALSTFPLLEAEEGPSAPVPVPVPPAGFLLAFPLALPHAAPHAEHIRSRLCSQFFFPFDWGT